MTYVENIFFVFWPPVSVVMAALLLAWVAKWTAQRSQQGTSGMLYQLANWLIASFAIITIIVLLPLSDDTQGQVLSLLGVVLTAVIALSATTFVANMIAGIMLQASQPFRPGDYIRVNDQFGRVTRRSLVHTQIQTEWRDLTNLPNLILVNNPLTVLHREGTIIFAEISIGYDVTYLRVEELLLVAGKEAKLTEPFVLVHELLDHAVVYRICGFLPEMKNLLSSRSNLRKKVLEQMHGNGVEIVSPSFMNQRALDPTKKVIPGKPVLHDSDKPREDTTAPVEKIFDKAEEAASIEELKQKQDEMRQALKQQRAELKTASDETRSAIQGKIDRLEKQEAWYANLVEQQTKRD
ncbi:MAG: mechanosensitive ion channel [Proteobacteria bacterium]|nr:mechanosensitive ion channel [Pseudomonadota bacterium]